MDRTDDNLTKDEQRVAELIGMLRHVEAPSDFDTRVRARIADRRGERPRVFWRPVLAGVAAVAVLAFAGYLGLRSMNSVSPQPAPEIAKTKSDAPAPVVTSQQQPMPPVPTATQETSPNLATTTKQPPANNNTVAPRAGGGSIDEALHGSNTIQMPNRLPSKGFDPSQPRPAANAGLGDGQIPVTMILTSVGIHATWNDGWHVDSVDTGNIAARSGVRTGDVVEALNGQPITEKTSFKVTFSGKSIRVRRDGTEVDLPFKP